DSRRRFAAHIRKLEAVPVQVNRVSVVRLIVEHEAIALALLKRSWPGLFIEAAAIDGPTIEPSFPAVDLAENERDRFIRSLDSTVLAKNRVVPWPLLRLHPAW